MPLMNAVCPFSFDDMTVDNCSSRITNCCFVGYRMDASEFASDGGLLYANAAVDIYQLILPQRRTICDIC